MRRRCRRAQKKTQGKHGWPQSRSSDWERIWGTAGVGTAFLGLEGETLTEGQLRTTQEDVRELFQTLTVARVVIEVGTHSAWLQDMITEWGHEVRVANPRLMEVSKRRKRLMRIRGAPGQ